MINHHPKKCRVLINIISFLVDSWIVLESHDLIFLFKFLIVSES